SPFVVTERFALEGGELDVETGFEHGSLDQTAASYDRELARDVAFGASRQIDGPWSLVRRLFRGVELAEVETPLGDELHRHEQGDGADRDDDSRRDERYAEPISEKGVPEFGGFEGIPAGL